VSPPRLAFIHYLRSFATEPSSGPVSPVKQAAQNFAARAATVIERGEHRAGDAS
jgi:hypothetical protein